MESILCNTPNHASRDATGYLPIENYGLIGNMHTCALAAVDGSIGRSLCPWCCVLVLGAADMACYADFLCW